MRDIKNDLEFDRYRPSEALSILRRSARYSIEDQAWVSYNDDATVSSSIEFTKSGEVTRVNADWGRAAVAQMRTRLKVALEETGVRRARWQLLSQGNITGSWSAAKFALFPLDDQPSPAEPLPVDRHYPVWLEVEFDDVADTSVSSDRSGAALRKYELLLQSLCIGLHRQPDPTHRSLKTADHFPRQDWSPIARIDDVEYYNHPGGSVFALPNSIDEAISRWDALSPEYQSKFLRAGHWLRVAAEQRSYSPSLSLISATQAIEALLLEIEPDSCECCQQPRFSITKRFKAFLINQAPTTDGTPTKFHKTIYGTRSNLAHGAQLFQRDSFDDLEAFPSKQAREMIDGINALFVTRIALRNWLHGEDSQKVTVQVR